MDYRVCLEQQLDELDLLQSVFSQPGEYTTDDRAVLDHATACVKRLTSHPPDGRLACSLHLAVDARVVRADKDEPDVGVSDAVSCDGTTTQYSVDVSMRLPHRLLLPSTSLVHARTHTHAHTHTHTCTHTHTHWQLQLPQQTS